MSNRILSLLIAVAIGALAMYFATEKGVVPSKTKREIDSLKNKAYEDLDSLRGVIIRIQEKRHQDSIVTANILKANQLENQRLKNGVKKVSFKHYTDPMLDSLGEWLYPKPR